MNERFETTRWSVVLAAGIPTPGGQAALAELCKLYWYPIYAFIRRWRGGRHDVALDLTQEFFARQIEAAEFGALDPARGRFRSWLLARVKHFLANDWDWHTAKKRDCRKLLWVDGLKAEERYVLEPTYALDPERIYECNWTYALLERSLKLLEKEQARRGEQRLFEQVQCLLVGPEVEEPDYAAHASALGIRPATLRVKVHRLRGRFRSIVRDQIGETVDTPDAIEGELDHLLSSLGVPEN